MIDAVVVKSRSDVASTMNVLLDYPIFLFVLMLVLLLLASYLGRFLGRVNPDPQGLEKDDFILILGGSLTLLGLIIGFTFSMAMSRYDQRKNLEEEEANAIGTEYLRLDILPATDAAKARAMLRDYLDRRIIYYTSRDAELLRQTRTVTAQLQSSLWSAITPASTARPNAVSALVSSGMNDVLNSEGYTEAAWRNRVPVAAWILLGSIAIFCNLLFGYRAHAKSPVLFFVLPIALSTCFYLIADIDSPRGGGIRIHAKNLESLAESFRSR